MDVTSRTCCTCSAPSGHASRAKPYCAFRTLSRGPQHVRSRQQHIPQAFLDKLFRPGKRHSPELVRLDVDDEGGLAKTSLELFGPLAVLLVGFQESEVQIFRGIMLDMEADMVKLIVCDKTMFQKTLREAMESPGYMNNQTVGKRAVIVSGMNAAEISEIIGAYRDTDLPEPVWAAALQVNWDRKVSDMVDDIYGDHAYMMKQEGLKARVH